MFKLLIVICLSEFLILNSDQKNGSSDELLNAKCKHTVQCVQAKKCIYKNLSDTWDKVFKNGASEI